jgi:uncharacterized protein involved in cysteine biosynthesis
MKLPRLPAWVSRPSLTRTITIALLVKMALLALLWKVFFSAPQTKHMLLPADQVEQHLFAVSPPPQTLSKKAHDEPR